MFFKVLNLDVECLFLLVIDLRVVDMYSLSIVILLREGCGFLFYYIKVVLLNYVFNYIVYCGVDVLLFEVLLDFLEVLEGVFVRIMFGDIKLLKFV